MKTNIRNRINLAAALAVLGGVALLGGCHSGAYNVGYSSGYRGGYRHYDHCDYGWSRHSYSYGHGHGGHGHGGHGGHGGGHGGRH